jgi:FkbM family methyltransferase
MLGALYYNFSRFGFGGLAAAVRSRWNSTQELFELRHPAAKLPFSLRIGGSDSPTYEQVFLQHEYDFEAVTPPKVIVDAGANIGLAAICFASRFPDARIIAIEPEAGNFKLLQQNVAGYPNVHAIQAALWNENSSVEIIDPGFGSWAFMTQERPSSATTAGNGSLNKGALQSVRALTVATLMQEFGLKHIDILKIDIEGAEREVFEAAQPWINQVGAMIVELHDRMKPGCSASFEAASKGFEKRWTRGENWYVSRAECIGPVTSTRKH